VGERSRQTEWMSVLLVSLSGLATSWSTYQAQQWSGVQSAQFTAAIGLHGESGRLSIEAGQQQAVDISAFISFLSAYSAGREDEAQFLRARLRPEFRPAFEVWLASRPRDNPDAAPTPFALPEYRLQLKDDAARVAAEAQGRFIEGEQANEHSDQYVLMAVVLSTAMFFAAICQPLQVRRLQLGLIVLATVLLLSALYNLAVLPSR
jgi:hypothetical protein